MIAFLRDERGATAVEVGLLVVLITLAIAGILSTLSGSLVTTFTNASNALLGGAGS